jgi:hypothetical protein
MKNDIFNLNFWEKSSIYQIQYQLENLFEFENLGLFLDCLEKNQKINDYFIYYCWFFSDSSILDKYLNRKDLPLEHLLKIILAGLSIKEAKMNPLDYFGFWSEKLDSDQSLRILIHSSKNELHPIFIASLLTNLNAKSWEDFFQSLLVEEQDIYDFLKLYKHFSINEREFILASNPILCKYLNLLVGLLISTSEDLFLISLRNSIEKILKWEEYSNNMKSVFFIENEMELSIRERNSNRISCIIHDARILQNDDLEIFLVYLKSNSVILDEYEFKLIERVMSKDFSKILELV